MPSAAVRKFTDPAEYAAFIRGGECELAVTESGSFSGSVTRIDLHRLWMQRFYEELPVIAQSADMGGRAMISFSTAPGPAVYSNGVDMQSVSLLRHRERADSFVRSSGVVFLGSMSLPIEDMVAAGRTLAGCDLAPPNETLAVYAPPSALARLRRLHAAAGHLTEHAPEVLANPEAASGLEKELIGALVACLKPAEAREDIAGKRRHEAIMRRFHDFLEANANKPSQVPDICAAIGVTGATLRACCQEFLGVTPLRYLWLRRMEQTRQALTAGNPTAASVTEIATLHGFWELGRFAVNYRSLFGESPSATLKRVA